MTLQEKLNLLKQGQTPIPMVGIQEITQALRLRKAGLTYSAISTVMSMYHGSVKSEHSWRGVLRDHGAEPRHYASGKLRTPPLLREES